jgi:hypothetical protein
LHKNQDPPESGSRHKKVTAVTDEGSALDFPVPTVQDWTDMEAAYENCFGMWLSGSSTLLVNDSCPLINAEVATYRPDGTLTEPQHTRARLIVKQYMTMAVLEAIIGIEQLRQLETDEAVAAGWTAALSPYALTAAAAPAVARQKVVGTLITKLIGSAQK